MEENVADALKMAAFMLIFIGALSITVSSFSLMRMVTDNIVLITDREYDRDEDLAYISYVENNTTRSVSVEMMVPTIMRAYIERYRIIFPSGTELYTIKQYTNGRYWGTDINYDYIDFEEQSIGTNEEKEYFLMRVLYGKTAVQNMYGADYVTKMDENLEKNQHIKFYTRGIYTTLASNTYTETVGIYYAEDIRDLLAGYELDLDTNKDERRVITYKKN